MDANEIRCRNDLALYESLLGQRDVVKAREQLDTLRERGYMGVRRRLLATSVRLSRSMAPSVHDIADLCAERLALDIPLELYVYSSPQLNAACFNPEEGRLFVMFSSSLLESFSGPELCFVMGHELGHHVYRHHDIPIGFILNGSKQVTPRLALDLFAWSRYAEVSADRAGAHCANDLNSVALALFRLASGLREETINFSLEEFLAQIDDMQQSDSDPRSAVSREDWFSTHPFSPLRVKALKLFDESIYSRKGGMEADALEVAVQSTLSLMEPSYLEGRTKAAESMRRLLFAAAIAVANADGEISETEIAAFERFFGDGSFSSNLDVEQIIADLPSRIEQANDKTSEPQRMQVLRDLCIIARSEDLSEGVERDALKAIAAQLGITQAIVDYSLCGELDPD